MIQLTDPYAFRSTRPADAVQAVARALEPTPSVPGADAAALGAWLGMTSDEITEETALLDKLVTAAVERCMQSTGYVPVDMQFEFRWDVAPEDVRARGGTGPVFAEMSPWAELTRRPLKEVTEFTLDGDPSNDYLIDRHSNPPRVSLPFAAAIERGFARLRVVASMGDDQPDPRFIQAALQLAAYTYDNRGCNLSGAMKKSGARALLQPLRNYSGGL